MSCLGTCDHAVLLAWKLCQTCIGVLVDLRLVPQETKQGMRQRTKPAYVCALSVRQCHLIQPVCSRIATGYMKAEELDKFHDDNGTTFKEAASSAGYKAADSQASLLRVPDLCVTASLMPCLQDSEGGTRC